MGHYSIRVPKTSGKAAKKRKKMKESYYIYIYKILKQVLPDVVAISLSNSAMVLFF